MRDISFTVRRGEILGVAGLVGSGRTQLAETIFGLTPATAGTILVRGAPIGIASPADAIAAGIAYVPEDRRQHGVVLDMSVASNASLSSLGKVSRRGLIDRRAERHPRGARRQFRIKTASLTREMHCPAAAAEGGAGAAVNRTVRAISTSRRKASTSDPRPRFMA